MADIVIIGGGIIGLAIASALIDAGRKVTLVDRDPEGDRASHGNAGGLAIPEVIPANAPDTLWRVPGWLMDPLGPLAIRPLHLPALIPWLLRFARACRHSEYIRLSSALGALNHEALGALQRMIDRNALGSRIRACGALTLYGSEQAYERERADWDRRTALGMEVQQLSGEDARRLEPALGKAPCRAVLTPQWAMIRDPKTLVDDLRAVLRDRGLEIRTATVADVRPEGDNVRIKMVSGEKLQAAQVVVAAGAWSASLSRSIGDPVLLESERGYNVTLPDPGVLLGHQIIFAERKFVAGSLDCGLRIGGAAEFAGLSAQPNMKRAWRLAEMAREYLPGLRLDGGIAWMGNRPATPDSLPVIGASAVSPRIIYAFGHGHLGLTQSAITAELVADLLMRRRSVIDLSPYSCQRFG